MPELSRFSGVVIRMDAQAGVPNHLPHFHAYYQEKVAIYRVRPIERLSGALPGPEQEFVEAWAGLHEEELVTDWALLQSGRPARQIEPLEAR